MMAVRQLRACAIRTRGQPAAGEVHNGTRLDEARSVACGAECDGYQLNGLMNIVFLIVIHSDDRRLFWFVCQELVDGEIAAGPRRVIVLIE